ncbi:hypothetical protein RFI_01252 [Reticulomyxa filosa]|uniref:Uncharacterized protein n=1 Tax=Reticulomyxa filosa TaxID=46433 RepID=X6PCB0_RETFI|nr:hypothetical protein RFI_01252 [Reticulomyxa filosa]|eukprot:ETO35811.1 hypothetical protein RFI_01252 [Reticulomyxa filosa]
MKKEHYQLIENEITAVIDMKREMNCYHCVMNIITQDCGNVQILLRYQDKIEQVVLQQVLNIDEKTRIK